MDAMAVQYARELALWGIETSIIVPGAFTGGTNHFAHSGPPTDKERAAEYEAGPYKAMERKSRKPLPPLFRRMRMRARWRTQSLKSWTPRLANARSASISIQRRTGGRGICGDGPSACGNAASRGPERIADACARGIKNRKQRLRSSKVLASMGSWAGNGKPEVRPPGWQIAPDKRASSERSIAGEKPTSQYKSYCTVAFIPTAGGGRGALNRTR